MGVSCADGAGPPAAAPAAAEALSAWTRLWPADDGSALLARGGAPEAPELWLWEPGGDPPLVSLASRGAHRCRRRPSRAAKTDMLLTLKHKLATFATAQRRSIAKEKEVMLESA
jgi:hypothetical protein